MCHFACVPSCFHVSGMARPTPLDTAQIPVGKKMLSYRSRIKQITTAKSRLRGFIKWRGVPTGGRTSPCLELRYPGI